MSARPIRFCRISGWCQALAVQSSRGWLRRLWRSGTLGYVPGYPCRDRRGCIVWRPATAVHVVGDVTAEPAAEFGLLLDVAAPPGGTSPDSFAPEIIWAIEQQEMDFSDIAAGMQAVQVLRDERAQQDGRHPGLGDAMGDRQPRITKGRPSDRLITAEFACGVEEPVDVEGDALALQPPGERGEHGSLSRTGGARDNEQRLDRSRVAVSAIRADCESVVRLYDNRAVT